MDPPLPHEQVRFAHNSERQFARLLDFYGIEWQYEPTTFVLERDKVGNPVQAFAPDFYLPAYDLYIEITTLNQKLVTKKNRKARRLTEQYPEVKIRVFYRARLSQSADEIRAGATVATRSRWQRTAVLAGRAPGAAGEGRRRGAVEAAPEVRLSGR